MIPLKTVNGDLRSGFWRFFLQEKYYWGDKNAPPSQTKTPFGCRNGKKLETESVKGGRKKERMRENLLVKNAFYIIQTQKPRRSTTAIIKI